MDGSKEVHDDFGISLNKETFAKINRMLNELREKAPYYSSTNLHFFDEGYKIRGTLIIKGLDKTFKSIKFGKNPEELFIALEEDMEFQLSKWKRNRFSQSEIMTHFHLPEEQLEKRRFAR